MLPDACFTRSADTRWNRLLFGGRPAPELDAHRRPRVPPERSVRCAVGLVHSPPDEPTLSPRETARKERTTRETRVPGCNTVSTKPALNVIVSLRRLYRSTAETWKAQRAAKAALKGILPLSESGGVREDG